MANRVYYDDVPMPFKRAETARESGVRDASSREGIASREVVR